MRTTDGGRGGIIPCRQGETCKQWPIALYLSRRKINLPVDGQRRHFSPAARNCLFEEFDSLLRRKGTQPQASGTAAIRQMGRGADFGPRAPCYRRRGQPLAPAQTGKTIQKTVCGGM